MAKLYKADDGRKMYPVGSWEKNQHKVYNAYDRMNTKIALDGADAVSDKEYDNMMVAMSWVDCVRDGLIYAPYKEGQILKAIIGGYDVRKGMRA